MFHEKFKETNLIGGFFSINLVKIKKFGQNQSEIQFEMEGICRINLPRTNVGT